MFQYPSLGSEVRRFRSIHHRMPPDVMFESLPGLRWEGNATDRSVRYRSQVNVGALPCSRQGVLAVSTGAGSCKTGRLNCTTSPPLSRLRARIRPP